MPPPRRRATPTPGPLTDADVARLREQVAAGEKPRVVVRAGSAAVAIGTRGNVLRLGDPKDSEYIVVRLGKDEVPFAPSELGLPGKPAAAGAAPKPAPQAKPAPVPATKVAPTPATKPVPTPAPTSRRTTRAATSRKRAVPPLVVTMRFRDGGWTVEAQRGARRLARATPLRPGAVSAFAEHVDDEAVRDALVETVDSCRAVIEQRASELREQLQAAEATLRDYESRPRRR